MSEQQSAPNDAAQELRTALAAAQADVLGALEGGRSLSQSELIALRKSVEDPMEAYQTLLRNAPESQRPKLEHTLGRQVIDLRRLASRLPQLVSGTAVKPSADWVPGGGGQPFIESRPVGRTMHPVAESTGRRGAKQLGPGDEVDAWCGPCNGLRTHSIVAMVGTTPKQVVCQACGGRHGFRLTPARSKPGEEGPKKPAPPRAPMKKSAERLEEERRRQDREKLETELAAAQNVAPFDPRRRYKAGQVIEHPEHGRGRIENVVRSSLLVRFPSGLKTVMTK